LSGKEHDELFTSMNGKSSHHPPLPLMTNEASDSAKSLLRILLVITGKPACYFSGTRECDEISDEIAEWAQKLALEIAAEVGVIGVMSVEMFVKGEKIFINELAMRPHNSGHWTIDGSRTSQFEQHLRAILDLPLGDPAMMAEYAVMGNILGGEKTDMYRPYLHLMARNPDLKFHQYKKEVRPGRKIGHVTATGSNLLQLTLDVQHARDYISGEIDE
jgi:5-(carboxyamino)imidazole ribonucleotide synthase